MSEGDKSRALHVGEVRATSLKELALLFGPDIAKLLRRAN
jgi:hypothetical protein